MIQSTNQGHNRERTVSSIHIRFTTPRTQQRVNNIINPAPIQNAKDTTESELYHQSRSDSQIDELSSPPSTCSPYSCASPSEGSPSISESTLAIFEARSITQTQLSVANIPTIEQFSTNALNVFPTRYMNLLRSNISCDPDAVNQHALNFEKYIPFKPRTSRPSASLLNSCSQILDYVITQGRHQHFWDEFFCRQSMLKLMSWPTTFSSSLSKNTISR